MKPDLSTAGAAVILRNLLADEPNAREAAGAWTFAYVRPFNAARGAKPSAGRLDDRKGEPLHTAFGLMNNLAGHQPTEAAREAASAWLRDHDPRFGHAS
jgi:hypothetical protein